MLSTVHHVFPVNIHIHKLSVLWFYLFSAWLFHVNTYTLLHYSCTIFSTVLCTYMYIHCIENVIRMYIHVLVKVRC